MIACSVRAHCLAATHCPWCVGGSEYSPDAHRIPHPAAIAARNARHQARRIHRHLPATIQGGANRRHGRTAERFFAKSLNGTVNHGSGMIASRPNDVYFADWQCEVRERRRQFQGVWRILQHADGILLPGSIAIVPYPVFRIYHPAKPTAPWSLPPWWEWHLLESSAGWTTLLRWIHDPREHPDVVVVRTDTSVDGHDAFAVFPWSNA